MEINELTGKVIGCAIEVHRVFGPGLLENVYSQCLARELALNEINFKVEHPLPIEYKGVNLDCGYRLDFLIEDIHIVELKAVDELKGIHDAQILTYLKLTGLTTGLLINFNVPLLKDGIKRFKL